ncbi:MAG: YerC/YecD family TrpR-related protein [Patescibacteria group bacterium]
MARYNANRIPYHKQDELMRVFCETIARLKTATQVSDFLKDLLNRQERIMLIRRLLIAELLLDGKTYREIQDEMHVGFSTIARVDRWLHFGRNGYKQAVLAKRNK